MGLPDTTSRPFYGEYAWACDLLIDRPVRRECRTIATWLVERRVLPGGAVLDAGCGTGRYAIELARRGYIVSGVDLSPDLIARALQPEGVVVLDVREWHGTAERKAREPLFRKSVPTERGTLTFTSVTELDTEGRRLPVTERHVLDEHGRKRERADESVIQCWTRDELEGCFRRAGFGRIVYFGACNPSIAAGATDRLVGVAQSSQAST